MDYSGKTDLKELVEAEPMLVRVVEWLRSNGCDAATQVAEALRRLRERKAFLKKGPRIRYLRRVVIGAFLVLWIKKNQGKVVQRSSSKQELVSDSELKAFEQAVAAMGDEATFNRVVPRMVRRRVGSTRGVAMGSAELYTGFVVEKAKDLAEVFLKNFQPNRPKPERAAIGYLETVSVSRYLLRESRKGGSGCRLVGYLTGKNRLLERNRLAAKLVELPVLLTFEETELLREKYGLEGSFTYRRRVKDVAKSLGYASEAVLSNNLYRIRRRAENWKPKAGLNSSSKEGLSHEMV